MYVAWSRGMGVTAGAMTSLGDMALVVLGADLSMVKMNLADAERVRRGVKRIMR